MTSFPQNSLVHRVAWALAKAQLTPNAPLSSIALLAEELRREIEPKMKGGETWDYSVKE
jgi:hypothetical protein